MGGVYFCNQISLFADVEVAPVQTVTQLPKFQPGKWTARKVVQLVLLGWSRTLVYPAITVSRLVIALTIAQTVTQS